MSAERIACRTPGCPNTILPATAVRTGGICRPCEQRIAREQHAEFVSTHRREVDPYGGVTDPVKLVNILLREHVYDELVVEKPFPHDVGEYFASLPAADIERLIELAIALLPSRDDAAEKLAVYLAAFTAADLRQLQRAWVDTERLYPGIVFRHAPPDVRDTLLELAESEESLVGRNHALVALAWLGDDEVVDRFVSWRLNPPSWAGELYISPAEYSYEAGWELSPANRRRNLYVTASFAIVPARSRSEWSPVAIATDTVGTCHWCSGPLTILLQCDISDARIAAMALPQQLVTCAQCTAYGHLFMRVSHSGVATWHESNRRPDPDEPGEPLLAASSLVLGHSRGEIGRASCRERV